MSALIGLGSVIPWKIANFSFVSRLASRSSIPVVVSAEETDVSEVAIDILGIVVGIGIGVLAGVGLAVAAQLVVGTALRKHHVIQGTIRKSLGPLRLLLAVLGGWVGLEIVTRSETPTWQAKASHALIVMAILSGTWLVTALVNGFKDVMVERMRSSAVTRFRRVQTQMQILNRVVIVVIWVIGLSAVLMTFEGARTAGASLFASAGLISVVAGIAAQSTLGNVFAGLQLAFSDSIRMGDIVIWQKEYAKVEDITLTYVVLKIWDGRRLIVPSSALTTQTFENWTREDSSMLGYVDFMVDWSVPIPAMRAELERILAKTDLWDGDTGIVQVRATESAYVQVSALVSARTPSTLTDLRYYVREHLLRWIQMKYPDVVPHGRNYFTPPDPLQEVAALDRLTNAGGLVPKGMEEAARHSVEKLKQAQFVTETDPHLPLSSVSKEIVEEERAQDEREKEELPKPSWKRGKKHPREAILRHRSSRERKLRQEEKRKQGTAENEQKQAPRLPYSSGVNPDTELGDKADLAPTMLLPVQRTPLAQRHPSEYESGEGMSGLSLPVETGHESSIFTGSLSALRRAEDFSGPGEEVLKERGEAIRRKEEKSLEKDSLSNEKFGVHAQEKIEEDARSGMGKTRDEDGQSNDAEKKESKHKNDEDNMTKISDEGRENRGKAAHEDEMNDSV